MLLLSHQDAELHTFSNISGGKTEGLLNGLLIRYLVGWRKLSYVRDCNDRNGRQKTFHEFPQVWCVVCLHV